ncbi:hypothetical protein D9M70_582640 [compost metagenome]
MHLVDCLGALTHQRFTQTVQNRKRLLSLGFGRNKTHRWPRRGFTDRFGIDEIVFVALDEGFNELRGNQLGLMPHNRQLTGDEMRSGTGLHHHPACWQVAEEAHHLLT